jgi:NAD(P)-dependent dehydrogenase (short-subunit alcohol dehydrogenase family)
VIDLSDRVVLLTGAGSGIGAATAAALGRAGARLVAHHRDAADRPGAEAATAGVPADRRLLLAADFADPAAADRLWEEALAWRGRIDTVVLNAAITRMDGGFDDDEDVFVSSWDDQWRINVLAPVRLMRGAVRHWRARGRAAGDGVLVTMASWNAQRGSTNPAQIAYAASKGALKAAAQTVARGYAKEGILSYVVSPGIVRTKMSEDFAALQGGEDRVTATLQMGEWVPPEELAALICFLATGTARHLTGATLDVNGATYVR